MQNQRLALLLCLLLVVLLRLPFLNEPVQGDDLYYLAGAQYAQIDPLHPHHARYPFQGTMVDMRGHPHPPLNTWVLAALLALTGDVSEPVYHGVYIVFSLIAAAAMWSLARRFSPRPFAATLLFVATPAFLVNGTSLEADVPFVAFWMAAAALFVRAVDKRSAPALAGSAAALGLAAMTALQTVLLVPVLALYLWLRGSRWMAAWAAIATPIVVLAAWQGYERLASGALPATVLAGYFQAYGLQQLTSKLRNAAALTAHTAWLLFPVVSLAAFARVPRPAMIAVGAATAGLIAVDPNPLFWASWGAGALVLVNLSLALLKARDPDERFLAGWVVLFFLAALAVFFAGAARYLLPVVAPLALLATRHLKGRTVLLGGAAASLALGLSLASVNYQHWSGYRRFVAGLRSEVGRERTWINGDWGLRFYAESEGALPLMRDTALRPGDLLITSELGSIPAPPAPRAPIAGTEIRPWLPFRIVGIGSRAGYSTQRFGLRPFDITTAPIDRVRAERIGEWRPTVSYLAMNAPEADKQIVSGLYSLENNAWRWTGERAVVALKAPDRPESAEATFFIPDTAKARRVALWLDDRLLAEQTYAQPGRYTLRSAPVTPQGTAATLLLVVDRTFQAPGDQRQLGVVLEGMGFKP